MELERTEDIVLKVLQKYEQTRSDDFVLVYAVLEKLTLMLQQSIDLAR